MVVILNYRCNAGENEVSCPEFEMLDSICVVPRYFMSVDFELILWDGESCHEGSTAIISIM